MKRIRMKGNGLDLTYGTISELATISFSGGTLVQELVIIVT
jgi:hypothetical protein